MNLDELVQIKTNFEKVMNTVDETSHRCGRRSGEVKLIVVTKSQPVEKIISVVDAGAKYLGENYPEETEEKIFLAGGKLPVEWHMIGHLQSRKSKIIAELFSYYHSLDRIEVAQKLDSLLLSQNKKLPVLVEVNVSGEESKHGLAAFDKEKWNDVKSFIDFLKGLPQMEVKGLMTMPPYFEDPQLSRPYFQKTRALMRYLNDSIKELNMTELSMGTSMDYCVAIEEGATFVRVGQAIMGERIKRL